MELDGGAYAWAVWWLLALEPDDAAQHIAAIATVGSGLEALAVVRERLRPASTADPTLRLARQARAVDSLLRCFVRALPPGVFAV